jgi:hypothetical protein
MDDFQKNSYLNKIELKRHQTFVFFLNFLQIKMIFININKIQVTLHIKFSLKIANFIIIKFSIATIKMS